jgi:hypothetical protein
MGASVPSSARALLCLVVTSAVLGSQAATARPATVRPHLKSPQFSELAKGGAFRDTTIPSGGLHAFRARAAGFWGGDFVASTGEHVRVFISDTYPQDPALGQKWADFLAGLIHGPELQRLTSYIAPLFEVQRVCGFEAVACYGASQQTLIAPGEDVVAGVSAESVITHEYGHHVAANRSNAPWSALSWGTKRWATYERVCSRARAKTLFPGAEELPNYTRNPGEGFAETFRVLNERRLNRPEATWDIVTRDLYPTDAALSLLEQDVLEPWLKNTTSVLTGTLPARTRARVKTFTVATGLDGSMQATLRASRTTRFELWAAGRRISTTQTRGGVAIERTTVCGTRAYAFRVTAPAGAAVQLRLAVSTP